MSAAEDTDNTNGSATLTHTASSTDTDYDGLTASVVVTEEDNENPGVLVSKEALTVRETTPGTYTVQLHTEPSANVTVAITKDSGGDADLSVSPTSLTFTPGNWNTGQTVTVTARRDTDSNYGSASFTHTASSTDTGYDGLTASVVVTAYEIVTQTGIVTADDTTANTASGTVPGGFPVSTTDATFSAGFTYGTFTIKADRTWTYTLDNTRAATQALQAGQAANETYRLQNTAQTAEFAITITINGADDVILSIAPVAGNGVMVSSSDAQRGEIDEDAASGAVALEVTLSESRTGTVTVAYATADFSSTDTAVSSSSIDPATAGADYTAASDTLTFAAGETRKTITVAISDDINRERDELFKVGLSSATGGAIIASTGSEATILIEDDDPQPKATITASVAGLTSTGAPGATRTAPEGFLSVDEGDSGNTDIIFTMTLEGTDYVNTNFLVTSTDGTATGNEDYRNFFALFPIAAGRTTSTVTLSVIGDENYEPDETVFLNFSLLGLVGVITNSADAVFLVEVTITNDDPVMATSASNLQARPAGSGNLAVSWDPAFSAPNGYSVRWRKASESDSALSAVNTVTATSYTITGLDNDTSYHVRLDTRNLANDGIASNTSLTIDATPTAGVAPTVTAIANQSALVGEPFEVDVDATPGTAGDSLQYQAALQRSGGGDGNTHGADRPQCQQHGAGDTSSRRHRDHHGDGERRHGGGDGDLRRDRLAGDARLHGGTADLDGGHTHHGADRDSGGLRQRDGHLLGDHRYAARRADHQCHHRGYHWYADGGEHQYDDGDGDGDGGYRDGRTDSDGGHHLPGGGQGDTGEADEPGAQGHQQHAHQLHGDLG